MSDEPLKSLRSIEITPAKSLQGAIRMPGDKSISHRYAMLSAIAEGTSDIHSFASSVDCRSTLACLAKLGVKVERTDDTVTVHGVGLKGLRVADDPLDAGNSGSTLRMLSGILSGQAFRSVIGGDASLSRRPMKRIIDPLARMGAKIRSAEGGLPPLEIEGGALKSIRYEMPIASAQVKSAVLFAGLYADGVTQVIEPAATRDHTEVALEEMGVEVERGNGAVAVRGPAHLNARTLHVPGDISSAAFFIVAALLAPNSNLLIHNAGLNPTRTAILDVVAGMGGRTKVVNVEMVHGELIGDLRVESSALEGGEIPASLIPSLIDELPVLAVLGTQTERGLSFHGASELRVKESDRISAVAENLRRMGTRVEEFPDGLRVDGKQKLRGAEVESYGDHRIAMAFAVAALVADGSTTIRGAGCAGISFPEFFQILEQIRG